MNLIKFRDIIADSSLEDAEFFNERLRGKYAFWIRCQYIIALEDITVEEAVAFEVDIRDMVDSGVHYIDLHEGNGHWIYTDGYIDDTGTDKVNSVDEYLKYNESVPRDITLDDLKDFRTWLADNLLVFKSELTDNERHVLLYYKNGMTDDTIKWLTEFGGNVTSNYSSPIHESPCGCGGATDVSSLYKNSLVVCDPISIYKNSIHTMMVNMFSDIDFWTDINEILITNIIIRLRGIIDAGLPISTDTLIAPDTFTCKCTSDPNIVYKSAVAILEELINSFNYILNEDTSGHKNTIQSSLNKWSDELYEAMEWN
jgi:hypothetical protein